MGAKILRLDEARLRQAKRIDKQAASEFQERQERLPSALDKAFVALSKMDDKATFDAKLAQFRRAFSKARCLESKEDKKKVTPFPQKNQS